MKVFRVEFAPEFLDKLDQIEAWIEEQCGSEVVAEHYTKAVLDYCRSLKVAPFRGHQRDDIEPGLRLTNYKGSTILAFFVGSDTVSFTGIYYGGEDYESDLTSH